MPSIRLAAGESVIRLDSARSARLRGQRETEHRNLVSFVRTFFHVRDCSCCTHTLSDNDDSRTALGVCVGGRPPRPGCQRHPQVLAGVRPTAQVYGGPGAQAQRGVPDDAPGRPRTGDRDQCRSALRMMHRQTALPHCDWGLGLYEEGIELRLPYAHAVGDVGDPGLPAPTPTHSRTATTRTLSMISSTP